MLLKTIKGLMDNALMDKNIRKVGDSMYTKELLANNDFFKKYIEEDVLDSLTKVISRKYILLYIKYLIKHNVPFSMGIIDLDNFKLINDNYGHVIGDKVLSTVAIDLTNYIGEDGFIGRFGGDEFIFVYLKDNKYEAVYEMIRKLYNEENVLRRNLCLGKIEPFVTGTTGCASYPLDAENYDDLFMRADKALYRGKMKGRNCFIVYVEEKHKDIDVHTMKKEVTHVILDNIYKIFEAPKDNDWKIRTFLKYAVETLKFSGAYYISKEFNIYSTFNDDILGAVDFNEEDIRALLKHDKLFSSNDLPFINSLSSSFYDHCKANKILSVLLKEIKIFGISMGYIIFIEDGIERLWQEEEMIVITFLSKLIGLLLN